MRNIQEIKKGMHSKNQDDWITFDEIDWIIEQAEKLEEIRNAFYDKDTDVIECYRKQIEVFEDKEVPTRKARQ